MKLAGGERCRGERCAAVKGAAVKGAAVKGAAVKGAAVKDPRTYMTPGINDTQHNYTLPLWQMSHFISCYAECRYAECCNVESHSALLPPPLSLCKVALSITLIREL